MKLILHPSIKNKNAIAYIEEMNNKIDYFNFKLTDGMIEAIYMALVFLTNKPIIIKKTLDEILFSYDQ